MSSSMNTTLNRLNSVTAYATTVLLAVLSIVAYSAYPLNHKPDANAFLKVDQLEVVRARATWHSDRRLQDYLKVQFSAELDLRPLFTWNTKQIFLSLSAHYASRASEDNRIVIWDRIIRRKEDSRIFIEDAVNRYAFREVSTSFANVNSTYFTLHWNVMPYVGVLAYGDELSTEPLPVPKRIEGESKNEERVWY